MPIMDGMMSTLKLVERAMLSPKSVGSSLTKQSWMLPSRNQEGTFLTGIGGHWTKRLVEWVKVGTGETKLAYHARVLIHKKETGGFGLSFRQGGQKLPWCKKK